MMRSERVLGPFCVGAVLFCFMMMMPLAAGPQSLTANAGPDRRVPPGRVMLDGRASVSGVQAPLSYQWTFTGGPGPARLSSDTTGTPSVDLTLPGTYTFGLRVYDNFRTSTMTEVAISVDDLPPSCGAGADRIVPTGRVDLTGFADDPNKQPLTVTWVQVRGPKPARIADPRALATHFVAAVDATGVYELVLRVTDGVQTTASSPLRIEVDDPPTAECFANPSRLDPGGKTELNGAGAADKNPEDNPLTYMWSVESGPEPGALTGADQPYAKFTAKRAGEYVLKMEVAGRTNTARKVSATTRVTVRNAPPVAVLAAVPPAHRAEVELDASASSDENGDPLTYEWKQVDGPEGLAFSEAGSPRPKINAPRPGTYTVQLVVKDAEVESSPVTTVVTFKNTPPVPIVVPNISCGPGPVYLDAAPSVDADGDPVRYVWRQVGGPVPVRIDDAGSCRPRVIFVAPGPYAFELQVNDGVAFSFPVRVNVNVVR